MWGIFINQAGRTIAHLLNSPAAKRLLEKGYKLLDKKPTESGASNAIKKLKKQRFKKSAAELASKKKAIKKGEKQNIAYDLKKAKIEDKKVKEFKNRKIKEKKTADKKRAEDKKAAAKKVKEWENSKIKELRSLQKIKLPTALENKKIQLLSSIQTKRRAKGGTVGKSQRKKK